MKKAFKSIAVGQSLSIAIIGTGSKVYLPKEVSFQDMHPELGNDLNRDYYHFTPMIGQIAGASLNQDGSHNVQVILIDAQGEPIPGENTPLKIEEFNVNAKTEIGIGQWCDNEEAVNTLCLKKNNQNNAGMEQLIDKLRECIDYNKQASRIVEKSISKTNDSDDVKAAVVADLPQFGPEEKSPASEYFKDTKEA